MTQYGRVRKLVESVATIEGAGVHLHRAIGIGEPEEYDRLYVDWLEERALS